MQAIEIFYNVLWWSKNARMMNLIIKAAATPPPNITTLRHHHIATATKGFAQYWISMPARVGAVIDAKGWYTQY